MRNIVILLILTMTMPCAASPELLDAVKTAEALRLEGKLAEAYETLMAVTPTVSETSPLGSLDVAYNRDAQDELNEFYLKDMEMELLVDAFLVNRESGQAMIATQSIANHAMRNDILFDILWKQCRSVNHKPEEGGVMIAKAAKTMELLTGTRRDDGCAEIARSYSFIGRLDLAVEAVKKIEASRRDAYFTGGVSLLTIVRADSATYEKTPENEKCLRELAGLVESPLLEARILLILAGFHDSGPKRLEVLRETAERIRPLPADPQTIDILLRIHQFYRGAGEDTEAEAVRQAVFASILGIEDEPTRFACVEWLFSTFSFKNADLRVDAGFMQSVSLLAEKPAEAEARAERWKILLRAVNCQFPPGSEEQAKIFRTAYLSAMEIADPQQRARTLLTLVDFADAGQLDTLLGGITETILTFDADNDRESYAGSYMMKQVFWICANRGRADRMLEIVHSPRIPETWREDLYTTAAERLLEDVEFRTDDFEKLLGLIKNPATRGRLRR